MNQAVELTVCAIPESGVITSPKAALGAGGAVVAAPVPAEGIRVPGHVRDAIVGSQPAIATAALGAQSAVHSS